VEAHLSHVVVNQPSNEKAVMRAPEGSYFIQAGLFTHAPTTVYLNRIGSFGEHYQVQHQGKYKVLLGPYRNEEQARKKLEMVRRQINEHAFLVSAAKIGTIDTTSY
jgi:site-specific DNA-adenine methylase